MKKYSMKIRHLLYLFAILSLLTTMFIWGNSLKSIPESSAQSSAVADKVQSVVDPQYKVEPSIFHNLIRKLAHVIEFFALGLFVCGFTICLGCELDKRFVSMPLLIVLLIAVGDEWLQVYTERGSLVTDVIIDFAGALAGLLMAAMLYKIILKIKTK